MKRVLTLLLILFAIRLQAQVYNNEWINFSQTYYKFKIGADGVYRIPESVLANVGLSSVSAQSFQLFRNGVEVPIYTSVPTGQFGPNDYIEFCGKMNDGVPDNILYLQPNYQLSKHWSLESDTVTYYLTVNTTGTPFHYANINNDTSGNQLPVEPYFMYTAGTYFKAIINPGFGDYVGEYIYSPSYDIGEGWTSNLIYPPAAGVPAAGLPDVQNNLNVYTGGPSTAYFRFAAVGDDADPRASFQAIVNNTIVFDSAMNNFDAIQSGANFPLSLINSGTATVNFQNNCTSNSVDRTVASFYEITYPRQFNFNNQTNFYFILGARPAGYYLNITNFNPGAGTPVLYDLTNGARYTAIMGSGTLFFELPGSNSLRRLVLVSEDPGNVNTVTALTTKAFTNFSNSANQGNYIIISNPLLYVGSNNNNPVVDYKNYRSSTVGGGFNPIIVDVNELIDQFGLGIKMDPLSVKNFLRYARNNFASTPQYCFLIGHGTTYDQLNLNQSDPNSIYLAMVPTFGSPASDNKLSAPDMTNPIPITPIGRLSVIAGTEIETYLQKVKEYDSVLQTAPNTIEGRGWMKNVVHVTGASDIYLGEVLCQYMNNYQQIIQDTLYGGYVSTFCKSTPTTVDAIADAQLTQLFSTGFSILLYFGHSSSSTLEYNLNNPLTYNNQGKYPIFYVNGCDAGDIFAYNDGRVLSSGETLSETYVLAKERGSIAFVASTSYGVVNYLNIYINGLYEMISNQDYGKQLGAIQIDALQNLVNAAPGDFLARTHAEEMTLHGDPAIKMYGESLPDYAIEPPQVLISPSFISVADTNFQVKAYVWNLGKFVNDSILVIATRTYPNGTSAIVYQQRVSPVANIDSLTFSVPILPSRDQGQNYITILVNADFKVPEVTTVNNSTRVGVYIYNDEAKPIYPYNFAIVNTPNQKLYASTANPLAPSMQYVMQMDTTALFNSRAMVSKTITSKGGLLEFDPGIIYKDSTVYYWRTSIVPAAGSVYHWDQFSFIYIAKSVVGYNQSHFYQWTQSSSDSMYIDSGSRKWIFSPRFNNVIVDNTVYPTGSNEQGSFYVAINGNPTCGPGCNYNEIIFNVIDPVTFKPWLNNFTGPTGLYNSELATCGSDREYNFDYLYSDSADRHKAMNFMTAIPNGVYVVARLNVSPNPAGNVYVNTWEADTTVYGSGNSLYIYLLQAGCLMIDSFTTPRSVACIYKKNDPSYIPQSIATQGIYDFTSIVTSCQSSGLSGSTTSPEFGPAKQWLQLNWAGVSLETPSTDSVNLQVIGVDTLGNQTPLFSLNQNTTKLDISSVNARQYPFMELKMNATDTVHATPYQLKYWRLNYVPVPEGAISPNIYLSLTDTLQTGQKLHFAVAFKNISVTAFDSMVVYLNIVDHNNVTHVISLPKKRPLVSGDTLTLAYDIDTKAYPGANTLYVDFNPNAQPEQYLFNNFLYGNFFVKSNQTNPVMDVTFDGVHILNQDIVSAKPHIVIKLTDASQYLLLNDTSMVKVQVKYPDGSVHSYSYNSDTLRFTPAVSGSNNVATVDFYPAFTNQINPSGDQYTLMVSGNDASGNPAGTSQYQIGFTVISKPMISNMLNYPNPFTTSTAFVFTITGSQIPQNIKIQILTITGKVVKEITEDELGPLHVGTNITQYKWNGTDMYGKRLANGVYIYHVVTNLNGQSLGQYKSAGDNTDQYFVKGYGKMYLMK